MATLIKFEELGCWQAARKFNTNIFLTLDTVSLNNHWALKNQLSSASLSIMNNIAEGFGRFHLKDRIRFFNIAHASCNEVKSMLYLIEDLGYFPEKRLSVLKKELLDTQKQLLGFIRYLKSL